MWCSGGVEHNAAASPAPEQGSIALTFTIATREKSTAGYESTVVRRNPHLRIPNRR
jgi:hypothetical protein